MGWLFLTLLSVLVVSVSSILLRVLMKGDKSDPVSYAIVFHFVLGFLNLGFALWFGSEFSILDGNIFVLLLACALWGACGVFLFKAQKLLEASEVAIVSTLRVVVTIVASVIFLHESFGIQSIVGTAIIFISTLLVVNLKDGFKFNKGLLFAVAMAVFAGLAVVADSFNVQQYDVIAYNTVANFLIGLMILAVYPKSMQQWKDFIQPSFLSKMLPLGLFSTIQGILYLQALTYVGYTAQIGTIRQSSVILTVLLAVIFLSERDNLYRKIIAAVLVTVGVFLLS